MTKNVDEEIAPPALKKPKRVFGSALDRVAWRAPVQLTGSH